MLFFGTPGMPEGMIDEWGRVIHAPEGGWFLITNPINGQPATSANGGTIGFPAWSIEDANAWHAAGVANGGTAIENPPGERQGTGGRVLYLAYLRDPTGNKICATHRIS